MSVTSVPVQWTVFDRCPDAIVVADADRVIEAVNQAFVRLFGYTPDDVCGRSTRLLYADPADFAVMGKRRREESPDGPAGQYPTRYRRKDGSVFTSETTAKYVFDEAGIHRGHVAIIRDVSGRVRLNELLRFIVSLSAKTNMDTKAVVTEFLQGVAEYFGLEAGAVAALEHDALTLRYLHDPTGRLCECDRLDMDETFCGAVVRGGSMVSHHHDGIPNPVAASSRKKYGLETHIGAPLKVGGDLKGVLCFFGFWPRYHALSAEEETQLRFLADWLGGFLEQRDQRAELERLGQRLAENARTFRRLYRETPAMLHSIDPEGRIVEVSDHWLRKMGYDSREEVLGQPVVEFHVPEQRERARRCIEEFWHTGEPVWNRSYDYLRKDGTTFEAELSVIVAKPKGDSHARSLAVSFDVTERNRAQRQLELKNAELEGLSEKLARTAQKFEKLYRETPAMLHSVDPEGRIVEVSDHWLKKMGYDSREEVIGRPVIEFHVPEQRERVQHCIEEFLRTGRLAPNRCYEYIRKDGATFEADISVIKARHGGDEEPRCLAVSFDVTERNGAQRQLEKKNDELERLNEELDTFASVASHDLQEPLRKIRRFSEIVEEELGGRLSGDGAYALEVMRGAAARMHTLINDLLAYAQTANAAMDAEPVDLGEVVDQVRDDLSVVILEAGAQVSVGTLPLVRGNAAQLRQLFQNLIGNAVKYRDPSRPCRVCVCAEQDAAGKAWLVSVEDNGIGFDPQAADRIFLPFSRLQPKSVSGGSGLGLTICGRIAERHGWSIRARSTLGAGSAFTIEIPAVAT